MSKTVLQIVQFNLAGVFSLLHDHCVTRKNGKFVGNILSKDVGEGLC